MCFVSFLVGLGGARGGVCRFGDPLYPAKALVPPGGEPRHLALRLGETFVAHGEAGFAPGAVRADEIGTLKDLEVLSDSLSGDRKLGRERAGCRFAVLEQQVEQAEPHRIAERGPQPIGVLAVSRHCTCVEPVTRTAYARSSSSSLIQPEAFWSA
jgi:hypothetical protein